MSISKEHLEETIPEEIVDPKIKFEEFLKTFRDPNTGRLKYRDRIRTMTLMGQKSVVIDFSDLYMFDADLAKTLIDEPDQMLEYLSEAIRSVAYIENAEYAKSVDKFFPRIRGLTQTVPLRKLRSEHVGKLIAIEGILVRATPIRQKVVKAVFKHLLPGCEQEFTWPPKGEVGEILETPPICPFCNKTTGGFKFIPEKSKFTDWQKIVIQEKPEEIPAGQLPRSIEVILTGDLVDIARPGDRVIVTGIVRIKQERKKTSKPIFEPYIEANYVEVHQKVLEEVEITQEDEEKIIKLSKDPWIHKKIIASIAPSIYGLWDIKEAIALLLFGGVPKILEDGTKIRGDIHVLIIGDPGMAKSQLLQYVARIAPRGVYTSGKGSTAAGLTAAVVRDKSTGEWYLEAGALVLADGGVCAIDEIDKMREDDRVAIHEAMEQQSYHKDFEILLADGTKVKIGEFIDDLMTRQRDKVIKGKDTEILYVNDIYVMAYDINKKAIVITKADRVSRHKAPDKFIKITFSNGRSIIVTPEHPILIWNNGRIETIRADKVKPGMITIGVNHYELVNDDDKLKTLLKKLNIDAETLGKFIGFILSDGFTYANPNNSYYEIGFSNTDIKLIGEFEDILKKMKIKYSIEIQERNRKKPLYTIRVISMDFFNTLKGFMPEIFIDKKNRLRERPSRLKRIPRIVFKLPVEGKKAFINAFFKGDGFVDNERIGFRTSSWNLAQDLQDILLTLGIYSYIETEDKPRTYYKVIVSGTPSIEKIAEILSDDHRINKIIKLLNRSRNRRNYRDELPHEIAIILRDVANELDINDGYLTNIVKRKHQIHRLKAIEYIEKAKCIIKEMEKALEDGNIQSLRRIVKLTEFSKLKNIPYSTLRYKLLVKRDDKLLKEYINAAKQKINKLKSKILDIENIINGNIKFIRIKNVEEIRNSDSQWVYDITVEPYHLFVSHGLVLHNTISIAKAGIVARLNARTAILAAGNPKFGRYLENRTIAENVNLPPTILSRFDLIFIIRDIPEEKHDIGLAEHILHVHKDIERIKPEIPPDLLRKYISYARRYIRPRLTEEAIKVLEDFFIEMRKMSTGSPDSPISITPRQLEALVRLAEAHAKMALRDYVTIDDALEAIRLMKVFLESVGIDVESGRLDIDVIMTGKPRSQQEKLLKVIELIQELEESEGCARIKELAARAKEVGISREALERILRMLKKEGSIYEPRPGCYAVVK